MLCKQNILYKKTENLTEGNNAYDDELLIKEVVVWQIVSKWTAQFICRCVCDIDCVLVNFIYLSHFLTHLLAPLVQAPR